uniref:Aminopeptidase n=1 Tax=Attheya septentrionalis TaxID=420275 RepID=A0A7S2UHQ9_9STRA|mmetsp:Transcript_25896/g.46910  ORF Transcript_25896/g.46910 Transcript_25896/m.46910 type:complete len:919 (+) Transcript_25896:212-2968(+)
MTKEVQDARLDRAFTPKHYDLAYQTIDLVRHTFQGTVQIHLEPNNHAGKQHKPGKSITLHALELNLLSATLVKQGKNDDATSISSKAVEFRYVKASQTCEIVFENDIVSSSPTMESSSKEEGYEYCLTIDFMGILNNDMRGLYRSMYKGLDGTMRTMATTQFEATDARRAFPCFDEPALKATFSLQVTMPRGLECISNTPIVSQHTYTTTNNSNDGPALLVTTTTFGKTPLMSTYLLALVIGEFDVITTTSETTKIQTSVYTVPGKAHQGQFCLDVATKCLDLYAQLFDVPYPLTKSDLLAIPDFAAGAMENWGCVTYREAKILVKEGSTSETMKRGIARTVCHELAHQWFGNLVTMDFWTQLWLNEGFARFMEFVGIDTLFPEWDAWTEFVQSVYGLALSLDSMKSSHPIEVEVRHPDEISEIFDAISYAKGASVIRMLSTYIGFETFLEGMKIYLKRHAYGNAVTEDLWAALEEASGAPVAALARPWTSQTGFPILKLPTSGGVIEAPRFLASGPLSGIHDETEQGVWPTPVTALVEGEEGVQGPWVVNGPAGDESAALLEKINEWSLAGKWFKLNASQTGFFRVSYTPKQWEKLKGCISPSGPLSATDRLGLISDSFAAGRAGYTSIVDSLKLVQDFGSHDTAEYAVWQELSENLSNLSSLYRSESFYGSFQKYLRSVYTNQLTKLGWEAATGESQRTGTLRGTVIQMLCVAGHSDVCKEAFSRFKLFVESPEQNPIPGDLRSIVYRAAMRQDEAYVFDKLKELYEASSFPEEQRNCLTVMASVKDMKRHAEMIDYVLFSGKVRLQDVAFPLNALASTTDMGGKTCWNLMRDDFDRLSQKFEGGPVWGALVGLSCRGLCTHEDAVEVEKFYNDPAHPCGSATRRLMQGLEAVRTKADRLERDRAGVAAFLAAGFA